MPGVIQRALRPRVPTRTPVPVRAATRRAPAAQVVARGQGGPGVQRVLPTPRLTGSAPFRARPSPLASVGWGLPAPRGVTAVFWGPRRQASAVPSFVPRPALVRTRGAFVPALVLLTRLARGALAPAPPVRTFNLQAGAGTTFAAPAAVFTSFLLAASAASTWTLAASVS
jgi:hypothetical protein